MFRFSLPYLILTIVLFIIEVLIALFVQDAIIRPHVGDVLVVLLIYCFLRTFLKLPVFTLALATLLFSYMVEALQYFKIVELLGLQESAFARVIIGTHFSWIDIYCYTLGFLIILLAEKQFAKK